MNQRDKKHFIPLQRKIILFLLPVMIVAFVSVYLMTFFSAKKIMQSKIEQQAFTQMQETNYHILSELSRSLGIMDNVKVSAQNCMSEEEIQKYIYSIADAYPDTIPTGIYCGLESGLYIDKMWTPDEDWVMKERPWYVEGLQADTISLGEMYLDADSGQYIISIFGNLTNQEGEVIGVISADVPMDSLVSILTNAECEDGIYMYGVDAISGLVFGDKRIGLTEKIITDSTEETDMCVASLIAEDRQKEIVNCGEEYLAVSKIEGTNFYLVYQANEEVLQKDLYNLRNASIFSSTLGILILCIVAYLVVYFSLKPVNALKKRITSMAQLDLTQQELIHSRDEMGQMSSALDDMQFNLKKMIGEIKNSIGMIDEKAQSNSDTAGQLADSSQKQYTAIDDLAYTMSELNRAIESIAEGATNLATTVAETGTNIEEAGEKISETKNEISQGFLSMEHMTDSMDSIATHSQALKNAVMDVKSGVQGITELVTVINDIATQTNLLSLNASIEAARAGEAGRGFAIVAEEIRTLSENVGNSVSQIKDTTENIEKLVNVVLQKTDKSVEAVKVGGDAVTEAEQVFRNISSNIEDISAVMSGVEQAFCEVEKVAGDMAASTEEQTASTTLVLSTSEEIKEMSKQFREEGNHINEQGQELKDLSNHLESQIGRFRV